jgi:hypothetical protein
MPYNEYLNGSEKIKNKLKEVREGLPEISLSNKKFVCWVTHRSWGSSGSIVSDYGLDDRVIGVRSPAGQGIFPLASVSRPALRPTQSPVQWVTRILSPGQSAAGA